MQFSNLSATTVLTLASLLVSPVVATPPACLLACVAQVAKSAKCSGLDDFSCLCEDNGSAVEKCLEDICPNDNAAAAIKAFEGSCSAQGKQVDSAKTSSSVSSVSSKVSSASSVISSAASSVSSVTSSVASSITSEASSVKSEVSSKASSLKSEITSEASSIKSEVTSVASSVKSEVTSAVSTAKSKVSSFLSSLTATTTLVSVSSQTGGANQVANVAGVLGFVAAALL